MSEERKPGVGAALGQQARGADYESRRSRDSRELGSAAWQRATNGPAPSPGPRPSRSPLLCFSGRTLALSPC